MLLILLAVLFLAGAAYLFGEAATAPARDREVSVKRAANYGKFRAALGTRDQPFRDRVIEPAVERLAKLVLRIHPKTSVVPELLKGSMPGSAAPFALSSLAFVLLALLLLMLRATLAKRQALLDDLYLALEDGAV